MTEILMFFEDPKEFLDWTLDVYEAEEGKHSLILGVALRIASELGPVNEKPLLAVVHDQNGQVLSSAVRTPPYYLLVHSDPGNEGALNLLAQELFQQGMYLPGSNGVAQASDAFARLWCAFTGKQAVLDRRLRSYLLHEVTCPPEPEGGMRLAVEADISITLGMIQAMLVEIKEGNDTSWNEERMTKAVLNKSVYVWDVNGRAVSMALTTRPTHHALSISGVYTPPEQRCKGYATALVARLSQEILDQGYAMVNLFTDLANPISNSIYRKIGFKPVCDYHEYRYI